MPDDHLSAEELAAYLDGRVAPGDRARLEGHLASCSHCRIELAETLQFLRRDDPRRDD